MAKTMPIIDVVATEVPRAEPPPQLPAVQGGRVEAALATLLQSQTEAEAFRAVCDHYWQIKALEQQISKHKLAQDRAKSKRRISDDDATTILIAQLEGALCEAEDALKRTIERHSSPVIIKS
jgi:hypothetical protein